MTKYPIIEWFWIDEDLRIKAIKTTQSSYWYARFNLPDIGQKKQSLKTKSKKQARLNGAKFANEFAIGKVTVGKRSRATIEEIAARKIARLRARGRAEKTLADYNRIYTKADVWARSNGIQFVDQLSSRNMERFEAALRDTGVTLPAVAEQHGKRTRKHRARPLGPRYLRATMKTFRGLIDFGVRQEMIEKDPCPAYELPPDPDDEVEVYTPAELQLIYGDKEEFADLWRFLVHTCLRRLELCWLMKDDVVFDAGGEPIAIHIRKKSCPFSKKKWKPKHGLERLVPLTEAAAAIIKVWLATRGGPWLFPSLHSSKPNGGRWEGSELLNRLHKRLGEVGIRHGVLHTFRHTGASLLANSLVNPMPLPHLQKFLGHKSIKTTQRYLHSNVDDVATALRRVALDVVQTPATNAPPNVTSTAAAKISKGGEARRKAS